ncbi:large-conductance mechanosensitive channel protein MscL [Flagellatimonas centrodinii]|uniref:large-conductance mechanosensitive channel protein MscL n=1 Tax=Flagellatimonas centrodinii TaxID=2806210 RepID=UPI001FFA0B87|nr:large-conductance mechanosensitive channel protein MscL [Flagellatimonas centrodinii]ULQ47695.1 large-conductance mechanosensitive channel protein MscL [Flagellatimonas centrodinii]
MLEEFKKFALRGNVIDLAVGVVIGAAFGKIVSSLVGDLLMPVIGMMVGGVDFADLVIVLKAAEGDLPAVTIGYGKFLQTVLDFIIIAWAVFLFVKLFNNLKKKEEAAPAAPPAPPEPSVEEKLLTEIRDLLKKD